MNRLQRIILIVGAVVLVALFFATPKYIDLGPVSRIKWGILDDSAPIKRLCRPEYDWKVTLTRGFVVVGATSLLCFAAGKRGSKLPKEIHPESKL